MTFGLLYTEHTRRKQDGVAQADKSDRQEYFHHSAGMCLNRGLHDFISKKM
jgi:hypothetical protein